MGGELIPRAEIVGRALEHLGHREVSPNRSPLIDGWIRRCGLDPEGEYPWCAAFASWCIEARLAPDGGVQRVAWAGALKLLSLFPATRSPRPGDIMGFATGHGSGHVGIVEDADSVRGLIIEGNSDNQIRRVIRLHEEVQYGRTRELGGATGHHRPGPWPYAPLVRVQKAGTR